MVTISLRDIEGPQEYMSRLRKIREHRNMTQMEVAEELGTSQTMYSRYERGATELPIRHLVALCQLYGVSSDQVLGLQPMDESVLGGNA